MTPERWERIKQTLDHAISLDTRARAAYLGTVCAADDSRASGAASARTISSRK
jgi:hypothetical protein